MLAMQVGQWCLNLALVYARAGQGAGGSPLVPTTLASQ